MPRGLSVCPTVRLSRRYCLETAERIAAQSTPRGSLGRDSDAKQLDKIPMKSSPK